VPVVFGPNYQKFREARELIASGGGFSISNYKELRDCFNHLLTDTTAGEKAGEYVLANTGATSLIIEQLTNDLYAKTIDS
jgi:3-deoxy-D-manno-octulosonic-acid transferase